MNKFVTRVYLEGWQPQTDWVAVKPNHLLVEPIKPDEETTTKGGILLPGLEIGRIPGVSAFMYRVLARGPVVDARGPVQEQPDDLDPAAGPMLFSSRDSDPVICARTGDVVVVRNAMVDPVHVNQKVLIIHDKHVLCVVDPALMVPDAPEVPDPSMPVRGVVLRLGDKRVLTTDAVEAALAADDASPKGDE